MSIKTADLCDDFIDEVQVAEPVFRSFGKLSSFHGKAHAIKVFEDNVLVRSALETEGEGRILVVDGGGSTRCALVGDRLASLAINNNWAGIIIYGCLRDSADINRMEIGIKALNTTPVKSIKRGEGQTEIPIHFAGIKIKEGDYIYSDEDGILVAEKALH